MRGDLFIHYESPLELELDVHFDRIIKLVEERRHRLRRVRFDRRVRNDQPQRSGRLPVRAGDLSSRTGWPRSLFNYESPELLGVSQISEELKGSHLVDNIILLNYVEISTVLRRAHRHAESARQPQPAGHARIHDRRGRPAACSTKATTITPAPCRNCRSRRTTACCRARRRARVPMIEEAVANGEPLPESVAPADRNHRVITRRPARQAARSTGTTGARRCASSPRRPGW